MKQNELNKLLSPFRLLINRHALAPKYRTIELAPDHIKACSSFGLLDHAVTGLVTDTVYVDAPSFLAVVASMPAGEVTLRTTNSSLEWACGNARGRLALMTVSDMPVTPEIDVASDDPQFEPSETNADMARAFELGAMSSDSVPVGAEGIYGVEIDSSADALCVAATDNVTVSSYSTAPLETFRGTITIAPPGAALLAALIRDSGWLQVHDNYLLYADKDVHCVVQRIAPLKHGIVKSIVSTYLDDDLKVSLPISAFIKRATTLAEKRRDAVVAMSATAKQVTLSFIEGTSSSDEYFLTDELPSDLPDIEPVMLSAVKVARALKHGTELVLDHIAGSSTIVVVFQSHDKRFRYFISAKAG